MSTVPHDATSPGPPSQPDPLTDSPHLPSPPASPLPAHAAALPAGTALRRSRTSSAWVGVVVFTVVFALLLIFILQNTQSVQITFFAATGNLPLAVAMLLAAVAGVLLAAVVAGLRIRQLRRRIRHHDRTTTTTTH